MANSKPISEVLGELTAGRFDDWLEGGSVPVPYFDGASLEVTLMGYLPAEDPTFLQQADDALAAFLRLGPAQRDEAADLVRQNCQDVIDCIGDDEDWAGEVARMTEARQIWTLVRPRRLSVSRRYGRDEAIYLQISCGCDWDPEHGLQLVYRKGYQLVRVSGHDGHLTTADAYAKPDEQDALLWSALTSESAS